jgi:hypothetical protein
MSGAELIQVGDIRWANFTLHFSKKISENDAYATADFVSRGGNTHQFHHTAGLCGSFPDPPLFSPLDDQSKGVFANRAS